MLVFAGLSFPFAVVTIRSRAIALVRRVSSLKETVRRRSAPVDVTEAEKIVYPNLALAAWNTCSGEVLARHFLGRLRLRLHGRREVGRGGGVKLSLSLFLSLYLASKPKENQTARQNIKSPNSSKGRARDSMSVWGRRATIMVEILVIAPAKREKKRGKEDR